VDELEVDVEDRGLACGLGDEVGLPDFFEEGAGCGHYFAPVSAIPRGSVSGEMSCMIPFGCTMVTRSNLKEVPDDPLVESQRGRLTENDGGRFCQLSLCC